MKHVTRGVNLKGSTIGIAFLGTMCTPNSIGVTQDGGGFPLAFVITIAAHEIGHNFNMRHDNGGGKEYLAIIVMLVRGINTRGSVEKKDYQNSYWEQSIK